MSEVEETFSHVQIDDLDVIFPYKYIYPEQRDFMIQMKLSLDTKCPSVIEVPPGIGRVETIFSVYLSYMQSHEKFGPIVYVSNTYQNYLRAFESFKTIVDCRKEIDKNNDITCISLGALSMQCNRKTEFRGYLVRKEKQEQKKKLPAIDEDIEDLCFDTSCNWAKSEEKCPYFENTLTAYPKINSITSFSKLCESKQCCSYWSAREILDNFKVIFVSDYEILNPKSNRNILDRLPDSTTFILDDAHFIDNTCCNVLSTYLTKNILTEAKDTIKKLSDRVKSIKSDKNYQDSYQNLRSGVKLDEIIEMAPKKTLPNGMVLTSPKFQVPIIQSHRVPNTVCGTVWNMEHYLERFRYVINYLINLIPSDDLKASEIPSYSSTKILTEMFDKVFIEPLALYFLGPRLSYFLATLEIDKIANYKSLYAVCDFCSLLATYSDSISVSFDISDPITAEEKQTVMQLSCHDASLAFSQILGVSKSLMICSSTLCVPGYYPQLLGFEPKTQAPRKLLPRDKYDNYPLHIMTVTHGNDQSPMRLEPEEIKKNIGVRRNIMNVIIETARIVPDGMVVMFPSMSAIQGVVSKWATTNQQEDLLKQKLIFLETYDFKESSFALDGYYRACDNGLGAVLFCVAGGKIARAIDLRSKYGRAIVILGYPTDEVNTPAINLRAKYLDSKFQFPTGKFIRWNSLRTALSSLSTVLASKSDYAAILLVDRRYDDVEVKEEMLPLWIGSLLTQDTMRQGVEEAKEQTRKFFTKAHNCEYSEEYRQKL